MAFRLPADLNTEMKRLRAITVQRNREARQEANKDIAAARQIFNDTLARIERTRVERVKANEKSERDSTPDLYNKYLRWRKRKQAVLIARQRESDAIYDERGRVIAAARLVHHRATVDAHIKCKSAINKIDLPYGELGGRLAREHRQAEDAYVAQKRIEQKAAEEKFWADPKAKGPLPTLGDKGYPKSAELEALKKTWLDVRDRWFKALRFRETSEYRILVQPHQKERDEFCAPFDRACRDAEDSAWRAYNAVILAMRERRPLPKPPKELRT